MKTDLSPDTDVSLLPRADLPVIWDAFKAKADAVRATAETLTVTCITQKEEMALARTTRLTLREIRIAVENKRVELGESHLKEIKKVNGAANAIKEFIQPLEARLLDQEGFADRFEANRIAELSKSRTAELRAVRPNVVLAGNMGAISQENYDILLANLRAEQAEIEAANRLRVEAEKRLAEAQAEAQRVAETTRAEKEKRDAEVRAELERQRILAQQERDAVAWRVQQERIEADGRLAEARAEQKRLNDEAEKVRFEQEEKHRAMYAAQEAIRTLERAAERERAAKLEAENAALEAHLAEAALEVARVAAVEEKRLRDIACAPDVEKLRDFAARIQAVGRNCPVLTTKEAKDCFGRVVIKFNETLSIIQTFCQE